MANGFDAGYQAPETNLQGFLNSSQDFLGADMGDFTQGLNLNETERRDPLDFDSFRQAYFSNELGEYGIERRPSRSTPLGGDLGTSQLDYDRYKKSFAEQEDRRMRDVNTGILKNILDTDYQNTVAAQQATIDMQTGAIADYMGTIDSIVGQQEQLAQDAYDSQTGRVDDYLANVDQYITDTTNLLKEGGEKVFEARDQAVQDYDKAMNEASSKLKSNTDKIANKIASIGKALPDKVMNRNSLAISSMTAALDRKRNNALNMVTSNVRPGEEGRVQQQVADINDAYSRNSAATIGNALMQGDVAYNTALFQGATIEVSAEKTRLQSEIMGTNIEMQGDLAKLNWAKEKGNYEMGLLMQEAQLNAFGVQAQKDALQSYNAIEGQRTAMVTAAQNLQIGGMQTAAEMASKIDLSPVEYASTMAAFLSFQTIPDFNTYMQRFTQTLTS
tara:strand:- start:627 stop:1961 length:1335 start_codon:yes stop_codon:yes gene_type:complete